jgi:hypothetical protein
MCTAEASTFVYVPANSYIVQLRIEFHLWVGVFSNKNLNFFPKKLSNNAHHFIQKIYFQVLRLYSDINSFY